MDKSLYNLIIEHPSVPKTTIEDFLEDYYARFEKENKDETRLTTFFDLYLADKSEDKKVYTGICDAKLNYGSYVIGKTILENKHLLKNMDKDPSNTIEVIWQIYDRCKVFGPTATKFVYEYAPNIPVDIIHTLSKDVRFVKADSGAKSELYKMVAGLISTNDINPDNVKFTVNYYIDRLDLLDEDTELY